MARVAKMESKEEKQSCLMNEFETLCKPLNEWLQKNYHPMTSIIIETGYAKVVEDTIGVPFKVLEGKTLLSEKLNW